MKRIFTILLFLTGLTSEAQVALPPYYGIQIKKSPPPPNVTATAQFSLRKLSNAYAGSAVRIRRSSDNAEQDIGFEADGDFDEAAFTSFVSGGTGFVRTWYDQSGNGRNAEQSSTSLQPVLTLSALNGRPSIDFTADYLTIASSQSFFNALHQTLGMITIVGKAGTGSDPNTAYGFCGNMAFGASDRGYSFLYDDRASVPRNNRYVVSAYRGSTPGSIADVSANNALTANTYYLINSQVDPDAGTAAARSQVYLNNTAQAQNNANTATPIVGNATYAFQIGATGDNTFPLTGAVAELYVQATISDITPLNTNINAYYTIY